MSTKTLTVELIRQNHIISFNKDEAGKRLSESLEIEKVVVKDTLRLAWERRSLIEGSDLGCEKEHGFHDFPAPLLPVLLQKCNDLGLNYEIVDARSFNPTNILSCDPRDRFRKHIICNQRGLIKPGSRKHKAKIVLQVAEQFPDSPILVLFKSKPKLREFLNDCRVVARNGAAELDKLLESKRLIVEYLDNANKLRDLSKIELLFVLEAGQVSHLRFLQLHNMPDVIFKMFAFTCGNETKATLEQLYVWFGPVRLNAYSQQVRGERHKEVVFAEPAFHHFFKTRGHVREARGNHDGLALRNKGIRNHPDRNKLIAKRSTQIINCEWQRLGLDRTAIGRQFAKTPPNTIILVENDEHAASLVKLLPDWQIYPPAQSWKKVETKLILKHDDVKAAKALDFDVLIRADGENGLSRIVEPLIHRNHEQRPVIVDFKDCHHPKLERWSKSRARGYMDTRSLPLSSTEEHPN